MVWFIGLIAAATQTPLATGRIWSPTNVACLRSLCYVSHAEIFAIQKVSGNWQSHYFYPRALPQEPPPPALFSHSAPPAILRLKSIAATSGGFYFLGNKEIYCCDILKTIPLRLPCFNCVTLDGDSWPVTSAIKYFHVISCVDNSLGTFCTSPERASTSGIITICNLSICVYIERLTCHWHNLAY